MARNTPNLDSDILLDEMLSCFQLVDVHLPLHVCVCGCLGLSEIITATPGRDFTTLLIILVQEHKFEDEHKRYDFVVSNLHLVANSAP